MLSPNIGHFCSKLAVLIGHENKYWVWAKWRLAAQSSQVTGHRLTAKVNRRRQALITKTLYESLIIDF